MKGPLASKATCLMTVPDDNIVSGTRSLTVPFNNRTFSIQSSKDGGNLYFTIYKVNLTTGEADLEGASIEETSGLSVNNGGLLFNNLILLEGQLKKQTGTFSSRDTIKTIEISDTSIIEGSIVVSSLQDGVYREVQNLFLASSGTEKVFEKVYDSNYGATLVFGDNVRGKSPVSNDSYEVFYRVGGGDRGNIPSRSLNVGIDATHSVDGAVSVLLKT